jgi:carbohydrate-selective porin OprB
VVIIVYYSGGERAERGLAIVVHKSIVRFHKRKPEWDLEKLYAQQQVVHDRLEEKLGTIKCESGNLEVEWSGTISRNVC